MAMVTLVGVAGYFLSTTLLMEHLPDAVLVIASTAGALLVAAAMSGFARPWSALRTRNRAAIGAVAAGAAAFGLAPLIVLSQRASDAPTGTEVLLFTTSTWGLLVCGAAVLFARPPRSWSTLAASLTCGVGGLGVLANWERPSSLSPFVRFPVQHTWMVVAGVIFAVGALVLVRSARTLGPSISATLALVGAFAVAVSSATFAGPVDVAVLARTADVLAVLAVFGALFAVGWTHVSARAGLAWSSVSLSLVPIALTGLSFVERALTVYGPNPILWRPAGAGIAVALAATLALWTQRETTASTEEPPPASSQTVVTRGLLAAGASALLLACVAMFTGGLEATIAGAFGEEYRATWTMLGVETAVGWLALATAGCALGAAADVSRGLRRSAWAGALLAPIVAVAYPLLADTPVRTATRWVPADVQQTLGTEYARISFEAVADPVRLASFVVSVAVSFVVAAHLVRSRTQSGSSEGTT